MAENKAVDIILTLDVGTSNIRCLAFDSSGRILAKSAYDYAPTYHTNGQVRQSADDWRTGTGDVIFRTVRSLGEDAKYISALSLTSQRASLLPIDAEGNPLYEAIMWHDKTTTRQCADIADRIGMEEVYGKTGLRIDSYFTAPKILWLRDNEAELYDLAACFMGVQDYVAYLLTGNRVTDYSQASRTLLFNIREQRWDDEILTALEIEESRLPELVLPGSVCGYIIPEFAERTGIPVRTPVVLAGGDQQVAAVGMGIFDRNTAEVNTGTGSFVLTLTDEPMFHPEMKTLCSYSAVPGHWVAEAGVLTTGILYTWFTRELGFRPSGEGSQKDFSEIDRLIEAAPPGSHGVITLPHFKGAAAPFWNQHARGLFFNLTLSTTRGDFARSIIESIALEAGADINLLNQLQDIQIRTVVVAGGMTSFELFNQIQADVYGVPVIKNPHTEATSFGAFLSAVTALGRFDSIHGAYAGFSKKRESDQAEILPEERYVPDPALTALYGLIGKTRTDLYRSIEAGGVYHAISGLDLALNEVSRNGTTAEKTAPNTEKEK